jgi:hypothetical protein
MTRRRSWPRLLLKLVVPKARHDDIIGDFNESGGGAREAVAIALAFVFYRLRARWWAIARWITVADLRFGLRLMGKEPVLAATATVAMGAAITVATMGYTFVEQMLYARLPFAGGDRFVRIETEAPPQGDLPAPSETLRAFQSSTTLDHAGDRNGTWRNQPGAVHRGSGRRARGVCHA